ncbi:MAG: ThiF family adenylyltransferase [Xanthobacteraceae bacterium]
MSRLDRQSFLGPQSDAILDGATIGIVGLGGGGSHIVQQSAHMGIGGYVNADPQEIEDTNTNRLIGGTLADVEQRLAKTSIAERLIRGLVPKARVVSHHGDWREVIDDLKLCDAIMGAVDSFQEREQLERFARRHLIPYIDIGMDVHDLGSGGFLVSGQVILSTPGAPCMRCCGFITDERLAQEAKRYGAAGAKPQVVWSNGVLASTAMGLLTQLLTAWYPDPLRFVFLEYDGNRGTLSRSARMELLKGCVCPHHPPDEAGDPLFDIRVPRPPKKTAPAPLIAPWWRRAWRRLRRDAH